MILIALSLVTTTARLLGRSSAATLITSRLTLTSMPGEQCTVTIFKNAIHDVDTDDTGTNADTLPANQGLYLYGGYGNGAALPFKRPLDDGQSEWRDC